MGDMADNGLECSVVLEKTRFDARETFPDFKLVFANKGEKNVHLLDDFYPFKGYGPNIRIEIWRKEGGKRFGKIIGKRKDPKPGMDPCICSNRQRTPYASLC